MAKKQPYTITEHEDKTVTLTIAGISQRFKDRTCLELYAENLYEQVSHRRTGAFRLQDTDNGGLDLIINGSEDVIHAKSYDDMQRLAEGIIEKLEGNMQ